MHGTGNICQHENETEYLAENSRSQNRTERSSTTVPERSSVTGFSFRQTLCVILLVGARIPGQAPARIFREHVLEIRQPRMYMQGD